MRTSHSKDLQKKYPDGITGPVYNLKYCSVSGLYQVCVAATSDTH